MYIYVLNRIVIFLSEITIELFQYYNNIEGVADLFDVLVYVLFLIIAIISLKYKYFINKSYDYKRIDFNRY
jgi:hypothetical protein